VRDATTAPDQLLRVTGESRAGLGFPDIVSAGEAVRISQPGTPSLRSLYVLFSGPIEAQRAAVRIGNGMELGVHAAFGAADQAP